MISYPLRSADPWLNPTGRIKITTSNRESRPHTGASVRVILYTGSCACVHTSEGVFVLIWHGVLCFEYRTRVVPANTLVFRQMPHRRAARTKRNPSAFELSRIECPSNHGCQLKGLNAFRHFPPCKIYVCKFQFEIPTRGKRPQSTEANFQHALLKINLPGTIWTKFIGGKN